MNRYRSSVQTEIEEIFPPENTRLYTKYTKRSLFDILLKGNEIVSAFEVTCQAGTSVSNLRDIIYEKNKNYFKEIHVDANKLYLWKVDIPYNNPKLKTLESRSRDINEENTTIQELGGTKLTPFENIDDIFARNVSKNIRIIVQPPATTVSSMRIIPDEVKIEIKNKVIKAFPRVKTSSIEQLIDALALIWDVEVVDSDSPGQQNDPYVELKKEPSFFKVNFPRGITLETSKTIDLCLPSYSKSGMNYHNLFYDDPQFIKIVSLVQKKIKEDPGDIIVLAGVSGGGKTSTAFGIAIENWSIYIDFSPNSGCYKGSQLQPELQKIRGIKPQFERVDQQNEVFNILDMAIVSRGLLLVKMLTEGKISTPKDWLFVQLQMNDSEIRNILGFEKYNTLSITTLITKINDFLGINRLVLIFDEAQVLCKPEYGKYEGSTRGKKWNLLQGYLAHLNQHPVTCLLAGTYMHMASGLSLVTSVGKDPKRKAHIVLQLPFLSHDDVLRNLDAVIDLTHVTPNTRNLLGYVLQGRPRNCALFVRLLTSKNRSIGITKNQVLKELVPFWYNRICSDMAKYLETACEYFGVNRVDPEKAIMDILRLRVFYNQNYKEAIKLLQHSIIPCKSPECIVLGSKDEDSEIKPSLESYFGFDDEDSVTIEINPSLESYLINSIVLYLKKTQRSLIGVFVDNIITLNNISSIGNEFDAVFITAIIHKFGLNVREELNKWKNGQQFDLPSWITPTMKFVTTSNLSGNVPIVKYVNDKSYSSYAIQPDIYSGSDVVIYLADKNHNMVLLSASCTVSKEFSYKEPKRLQIRLSSNLNYDLNYAENTKNYQISKVSKRAEYHEKIKTSTENRKHIYVSVELPYRKGERSELFRLNEYDDLVIIVDDRNMEHVFGPDINRLMERISKSEESRRFDEFSVQIIF
ncbi:16004_t:CDS:2 [Funneliformis geosporum]|uniref:16004_t:CDS:1 n=1 Tax=Funneliformis geosporum TaxID=1117311 RepID=A0A9W4T0F5_9GLOM|nr:16004_t:CDS:2 [Funneliformis geosporum]